MYKFLKFAAFALLFAGAFAACSDDDESVDPTDPTGPTGPTTVVDPTSPEAMTAYVINQGNMYGGVAGSIDGLNSTEGLVVSGLFQSVNSQSLGDTPQAAVRYGSHIYVPVYASNVVWVLDASTLQIVKQITTDEPEAVCGIGDYVFVANNTGTLTRISTADFTTTVTENVGPNPAGLAAAGGSLYVTISDGYNYTANYENGKKVVALNPETMEVEATYGVGLNPGQIVANGAGELFVVARGDYAGVPSTVQKIATDGTVTDYAAGSLIAMHGDSLYVLDAATDWTTGTVSVSSACYDTRTGASVTDILPAGNVPPMPNAIDVDPGTGHVYVCADKGAYDYDKAGYVYVYAPQGDGRLSFSRRYDVGVHPYSVVFK